MQRGLLIVALLAALLVTMRRGARQVTVSPPPSAPPQEEPLTRLRFGVRHRRHGRRRHGRIGGHEQQFPALENAQATSSGMRAPSLSSERTAEEEHKRPQDRREKGQQGQQRADDPRQPSSAVGLVGVVSGEVGRCAVDGSQTGDGCHGHACLLGACFCRAGSGGDFCERRSLHRRSCEAEAAAAYRLGSTGLMRYALHDACAFYEPAYGILQVDDRRWRAAQCSERTAPRVRSEP